MLLPPRRARSVALTRQAAAQLGRASMAVLFAPICSEVEWFVSPN
jgi:hypothetical protein